MQNFDVIRLIMIVALLGAAYLGVKFSKDRIDAARKITFCFIAVVVISPYGAW